MAIATNTRRGIRQELLKRLDRNGVISATTSDGNAGKTTMVDSLLNDSNLDPTLYDGGYVNLLVATPEVRRVTAGGFSAGILTLGRAATSQIVSGTSYELWTLFDPTMVDNAINRTLERHYYTTLAPLSFCDDPDMESVDATTWTGSNATPTKQTYVLFYGTGALNTGGQQVLQVIATAANGYATAEWQSAPWIPVTPGEKYWLSVLASALNTTTGVAGEAWLRAYDLTNSAVIETVTYTGREPNRLHMSAIVPADCHRMSIQLGVTTNTQYGVFDDLIIQPEDSRRLPLPSWVTQEGQIEGVYKLVDNATNSGGDDSSLFNEWHLERVRGTDIIWDHLGPAPGWVHFPYAVGQDCYYIVARKAFSTLSADTAATAMNKDLLLDAVTWELYSNLIEARPEMQVYRTHANDAKKRYLSRMRHSVPLQTLGVTVGS